MRHIRIDKLKIRHDVRPDTKKSEPYVQLRESVREHGILNPIVITPELETGNSTGIISIAVELGIEEVPFVMWPYIPDLCDRISTTTGRQRRHS